MADNENGFHQQILSALEEIPALRKEVAKLRTDVTGEINVLSRRMDRMANEMKEMPARLERQIRISVARDQARVAEDNLKRLEASL